MRTKWSNPYAARLRVKAQWWHYEVRRGVQPSIHERTYLSRGEATSFALESQKVRGGIWTVRRVTKKGHRQVAVYNDERHE